MLVRNNILEKLNNLRGLRAFSTELKEENIKIGNHNINYLKVGHGPHSVIFTPGGLGTIWTNYKEQILGFDRKKFTVVVFDPPGYGKSYPPERNFSSDDYELDADVAYELMKVLNIPRYSALGWSAGGSASLIHAAKYPQIVRKVVAWSVNVRILPDERLAYTDIRDVSQWAKHLRDPMVEAYGKDRFAEYWAKWVDKMSVALEAKPDFCSKYLKDVICPTMILHGAKDSLAQYTMHVPYLQKNIKNSSVHIYPNGRHDIHIRYAQDFNRRVQDFLLLDDN